MNNLAPADSDESIKESLSFKTEVRFLGKDHVGSVKHFEGVQLSDLMERARQTVSAMGLKYEDEMIDSGGRRVYTNVAPVGEEGNMYLWIKGVEVKDVGVVVELKVIHDTEASAIADELLSKTMADIEGRLTV